MIQPINHDATPEDIEISKRICKKEGWEYVSSTIPWPQAQEWKDGEPTLNVAFLPGGSLSLSQAVARLGELEYYYHIPESQLSDSGWYHVTKNPYDNDPIVECDPHDRTAALKVWEKVLDAREVE